jgi:tRNA threonylcarbamoyl adenosine modification protein YeaZ
VLVLALDTSSAAVSAAVVEDGQGLALRRTVNARGHGELLAPNIVAALADAGATPKDLDAIVVGTGPGPYTGLRVGLVTAAVLSETLDIPAYGVCSLDGMAAQQGALLVAADARRKEVYWARYEDGTRVRGPEVARPGDVPRDGIAAMAGAGARLYAEILGLPLTEPDHPEPAALVRRAVDRISAGAASDPLTPLYLRRPDAFVPGAPKPVLP